MKFIWFIWLEKREKGKDYYKLEISVINVTERTDEIDGTDHIRRAGEESQFLSSFQNLGAALDEELYRAIQAPMHLK